MRFDDQCPDRHTCQHRSAIDQADARHQQRPGDEAVLGMRRRDQRARKCEHEDAMLREDTQSHRDPERISHRHPDRPRPRQRQRRERRHCEKKWRRVDESEPADRTRAGLQFLLQSQIVSASGIAAKHRLARAPERQKIRSGRLHGRNVSRHQQPEGCNAQQGCIGPHARSAQPVGTADRMKNGCERHCTRLSQDG